MPIADSIALRDAAATDVATFLRLNAASVERLSPLDASSLGRLLAQCALARVATVGDDVVGMVLALREGADYASPNYRWFAAREAAFLYVDRVVVHAAHRGRGVARRLYADVFAHARAAGLPRVACEFDLDPPNPASARFHAAQGFVEVGRQVLPGGKAVSLQCAPVAPRLARDTSSAA